MLIAILGVLATVAVTMVGKQKVAVMDTKLLSDVSALNHHVAMYLADGGSLTGLTSPQAVIDRLKRTRAQADWQTHTGAVSGRLVDTRLRATITNAANTDGKPRAQWNTRTERFELTTAGGQAVSEFTFDEALRNTEYGTDSNRRAGRVKYNASSRGWIWGGAQVPPQPLPIRIQVEQAEMAVLTCLIQTRLCRWLHHRMLVAAMMAEAVVVAAAGEEVAAHPILCVCHHPAFRLQAAPFRMLLFPRLSLLVRMALQVGRSLNCAFRRMAVAGSLIWASPSR